MAKKITRKQLKRNDLVETMGRTVDYVSHHRRGVTEGMVAAAVVAVLIGGFLLLRSYRESQAGKELSAALAVLDTPIAGQPAALGAAKAFATVEARDKEADGHLRKSAGYPGTSAGRAAALILAARDRAPNAETFARTARVAKAEVAASAELDAARLLAAQGKKTEAIDRLKRAIESGGRSLRSSSPAPRGDAPRRAPPKQQPPPLPRARFEQKSRRWAPCRARRESGQPPGPLKSPDSPLTCADARPLPCPSPPPSRRPSRLPTPLAGPRSECPGRPARPTVPCQPGSRGNCAARETLR